MSRRVWYRLKREINHFGLCVHPYKAFPKYLKSDYCERDLRKRDSNRWLKHTWNSQFQPLKKKEINNSFLMSQDFLKKGEVFFCQPDITKQRDTSCCFLGPKKKVQKTSKHNYWFFLSLLLPDTLLCEDFRCSRQEVNKARDAALFSL